MKKKENKMILKMIYIIRFEMWVLMKISSQGFMPYKKSQHLC